MRIHALAVLCSSFLLFAIQPIVAKAILPWFGGSPAVWTTCMLFFQAVLLAGYAYAHLLVRFLAARQQAWVHAGLLVATLLLLPVAADPAWQPAGDENPSWRILGLLGASVGLPYFLLSSTAPLIQSWASGGSGAAPYRLYALSNAGSLAALIGYPFGIEPALTTATQFSAWSAGYGLFVALSVLAALGARRPTAAPAMPAAVAQDGELRIGTWGALPALSSLLLLAVTNQMCQEIAVVPLLWLLPLTIYLLTFILCFESDRWYRRKPYLIALGVLSALALLGYIVTPLLSTKVGIPLFAAYLFVACMACHGELVQARPATRHLTLFYLMIALGGVAGGILVALVAPLLFSGYFELPIGVILTLFAIIHARDRTPLREWVGFGAFLLSASLVTTAFVLADDGPRDVRVTVRNFYGALRVADSGEGADRVRTLVHGRTIHGTQFVDPARRREPLSYFDRQSGAGLLLARFRAGGPRRIGVLGLGAGTLSAYALPQDTFRYYEINPLIVRLAREEFSYLADAAGRTEIVTADARLALEREAGEPPFDVLIGDAFSGDGIPVHLLTAEAFGLYFKRLGPGGVLALHISNRHLDLRPVVAAGLAGQGAAGVLVESKPIFGKGRDTAWVLAARDASTLDALALPQAKPLSADRQVAWRDDFSNLLQVLK